MALGFFGKRLSMEATIELDVNGRVEAKEVLIAFAGEVLGGGVL